MISEMKLIVLQTGGEKEWLQKNWPTFKSRAEEGDEDMRRLVLETDGGKRTTGEQNNEEKQNGDEIPDRTKA